ncbi:hypothetical protein [Sinorhizobium psoraleae]|uniref:Transposase n=1 Tax=Sinorhizobium psoraleae TaxID=520838 RepID=A0ABT4KID4_9HYPH|nr:hypothetical protein [Sinorhizobium psoraleae]MCZ4091698.1 hypothetical protein [Sinorhizobium psoraleae]
MDDVCGSGVGSIVNVCDELTGEAMTWPSGRRTERIPAGS